MSGLEWFDEPMQKHKLSVSKCTEAYRGVSQTTGGEYVMYDVEAVDESGEPIGHRLRAYQELPLDKLQEFEVHRFDNERYGTSYTLKLPKAGARLGPKVDELRDRVDRQAKVINALIAHIAGAEIGSANHHALRDKLLEATRDQTSPGGSSGVESDDRAASAGPAGPNDTPPDF